MKLPLRKQKQRARSHISRQPEARKPTFSYHASRSANEAPLKRVAPDAAKRIEGPPWWHLLPSMAATVAVILCLLYLLGLSTNPKVVEPSNNSATLLRPKAVYEHAAQLLFEDSILNRSKVTVDTGGIARKLKQQFPELADVTIALPMVGRRPIVYIAPSPPAISLLTSNGTYVVNAAGKAIVDTDKTPISFTKPLPTVVDQSGLSLQVGSQALPADYVSFITTVVSQLQIKQLRIKSMVLPARAEQLDVQFDGQSYSIKMNLKDDAKQQVGAFLAAKKSLEQNKQPMPSYFDVRVPERVYYK
jgi:hypothetical protein